MSEISFTQFPTNFYVPGTYVEISTRRAQPVTSIVPQKMLLVGQKLAAGTATEAVPVLVTSADQAGRLCGRGSQLHHMAIAALAATYSVPVWLLPLADAAGATQSTRTVTLTGSPTAAGTVYLYIGGRRYAVNAAAAATVTTIAAAIATAINADDLRHVDASAALGVVTLTARHGGIDAGEISCTLNRYSDERLPAGLTVAISALTAGTGNPDIADAIAAIPNAWYTRMAIGWSDTANMTALKTELLRRNGPIPQIEGVAFVGLEDTIENELTWASGRNCQFIAPVDNDSLSPKWKSAAFACSVSATLAQQDPGLPENRQEMPELLSKPDGERRSITDRQQLLAGGVGTLITDESGVVRAEYFVTSYRTNDYGAPDLRSWFDVCRVNLWAQTRYGIRLLGVKLGGTKLGQNGSTGKNVITPSTLNSEAIAFYKLYIDEGWYEGGAAFEKFKAEVSSEIDTENPNRANLYFPPDFINQLRVQAVLVEPVG
ncbi:hypothetical protein [Solimonas flava]|uniref:hypothetical protein n=1 Tax=Solimonas flava TaxID=415849 RepID=UPI0004208DC4|nr:hypothetical protein [Solimonas flava]